MTELGLGRRGLNSKENETVGCLSFYLQRVKVIKGTREKLKFRGSNLRCGLDCSLVGFLETSVWLRNGEEPKQRQNPWEAELEISCWCLSLSIKPFNKSRLLLDFLLLFTDYEEIQEFVKYREAKLEN